MSARSVINKFYSQCQPKGICLNPQYGQCGGVDKHQPPLPWTKANNHSDCCPDSFDCTVYNPFYSQCEFNATGSTCATKYAQCGGEGWTGPTCCIPGFECQKDAKNPKYYSGCQVCLNTTSDPGAHLLVTSFHSLTCADVALSQPAPVCSNARFGQCGGIDAQQNPWDKEHHHDTCCPDGFACKYVNQFFSQCKLNITAIKSFEEHAKDGKVTAEERESDGLITQTYAALLTAFHQAYAALLTAFQ